MTRKERIVEFTPLWFVRGVRKAEGHIRAGMIPIEKPGPTRVLPPIVFWPLFWRLTSGFATVLDIGCGTMNVLKRVKSPVRVGVDAHRAYLEHRPPDPTLVPIHLDARRLGEVFVPRSFALITMTDVIEHFEREAALDVMQQAETIASGRCVIVTPRGQFPQRDFDAYSLGGESLQTHRSEWEPEDFRALGYMSVVFRGLHGPGNPSFDHAFPRGGPPIDGIVAWKNVERKA